jgi:hypothetical protein
MQSSLMIYKTETTPTNEGWHLSVMFDIYQPSISQIKTELFAENWKFNYMIYVSLLDLWSREEKSHQDHRLRMWEIWKYHWICREEILSDKSTIIHKERLHLYCTKCHSSTHTHTTHQMSSYLDFLTFLPQKTCNAQTCIYIWYIYTHTHTLSLITLPK